jgi:hypothetical protein
MRLVLLPELLTLLALFTVPGSWGISYGEAPKDLDHDGLEDPFEQEILARFLPEFRVSKMECAGLPAEFLPDSTQPQAVALNGTIYGQVFPVAPDGISGSFLEVHYYHLWSRDCGRFPCCYSPTVPSPPPAAGRLFTGMPQPMKEPSAMQATELGRALSRARIRQ